MIRSYPEPMKTILARSIAVALACLVISACSEPPPPPKPAAPATPAPQAAAPAAKAPEVKPEPPKPDPNKELAQRVKQALEGDGKIQGAGMDVTAADGRVTLWGTTTTAAERNRAGQIASKVEGVTAVDNQLKVVKGS
jgi:hyperosmotically inducible periplasmic protein